MKYVKVKDHKGEIFEVSQANANDLIRHLGWTRVGDSDLDAAEKRAHKEAAKAEKAAAKPAPAKPVPAPVKAPEAKVEAEAEVKVEDPKKDA